MGEEDGGEDDANVVKTWLVDGVRFQGEEGDDMDVDGDVNEALKDQTTDKMDDSQCVWSRR